MGVKKSIKLGEMPEVAFAEMGNFWMRNSL